MKTAARNKNRRARSLPYVIQGAIKAEYNRME